MAEEKLIEYDDFESNFLFELNSKILSGMDEYLKYYGDISQKDRDEIVDDVFSSVKKEFGVIEVGISDTNGETSYGLYRQDGERLLPILQESNNECIIRRISRRF
jgi:hypothetical protein